MKKLILLTLIANIWIARSQKSAALEAIPIGKNMAIGLSVNSQNRVFVSFPNRDGDGKYSLTELKNGQLLPYPDTAWNTVSTYTKTFRRVQDLFVDKDDNLWVLDSQPSPSQNIFGGSKKTDEGQFKLVKIDTKTDQVEETYLFEDLDKSKSALNDLRVDLKNELVYLSDPGLAAIVVLDLKTGKSREALSQTKFTLADDFVLEYDGVPMKTSEGKPFVSNVNSIALTQDFRYFYFKPINKENLFRIETRYLADEKLSEKELESKVEDLGKVGVTHGLIADAKGNIFLSTSKTQSISYLTRQGELKTLVQDKRLRWPDSFGIGTDGYLYFSDSQLQRLPQWNNGVDKTEYPYHLYRVKLP